MNGKKKNLVDFKLVCLLLVFIVSYVSLFFVIRRSFSLSGDKSINFNEVGNVDYKVYLKDNKFYDDDYLDEGMSYVSNLIDNIKINFDYKFGIDSKSNIDFKYSVIANLSISDVNSGKKFFSKDYTIIDSKSGSIVNDVLYGFNESITIDYDYYNMLANSFKNSYGVNASSDLNVYIRIDKISIYDSLNNNSSVMAVSIPLTEKAVNIKIDSKDLSNYSEVIGKSSIIISNYWYLGLSIIIFIIDIYLVIVISKMISNGISVKSKFDRYVSKLLREYDRLIVETSSFPIVEDLNVFNISSFSELLDVRDNIRLPIMYFSVVKHKRCYFYIKNNNDLYLYDVKISDING